MRKTLLTFALAFAAAAAFAAPKMEDWQDPNVFEINRLPMHASFVTEQQQTLSLNGLWKFHFNESIEGRLRGFEAPGFDDSTWDDIPVPGLWELEGYGDPLYVNVGYPWRGHYQNNPPYPALEHNYVGQYRRKVDIPAAWIGKQICLNIGSATSNVRVWVNGKMVGYSEDSKLEARFDLTRSLKAGENLIALEIFRWCDGTYLEDQDFWRFAGIARGVELYTRETERLEDVHVVAGMDGSLALSAEVTKGIVRVDFDVVDASGTLVGSFSAKPSKGKVRLEGKVGNPLLWSAEEPNLYTLQVRASGKKGVVESTAIPFGFRTVTIENVQLLVNGQPVLIKGVDRHELDANKGYIVSEEDMIRDIRIMKELNINAVRTCHYPDDPRWLSLCDRYGLYVVDEGNIESHGMGYADGRTLAQNPLFAAAHLVRDQRMVYRDFNHPSVIIWSLGNEAGNGPNFKACYDWIKAYDPSRPVQYERALLNNFTSDYNTDIYCPMYESPDNDRKYLQHADKPLIQCEYAHAMGNSMGAFKEYWDLIRSEPSYQGGFIWDFADQALRVPSKAPGTDHIYAFGGDFNAYDPSDGSFNCNGVIAADRSLHPHACEVRYQYRNILTSAGPRPGVIRVVNEFFFRTLERYRLLWDVEADGVKVLSGVVEKLDVAPQSGASVNLKLGELPEGQVVTLNVHYVLKAQDGLLPAGYEVAYDQIVLRDDAPVAPALAPGLARREGNRFSGTYTYPGTLSPRQARWEAAFDPATGALASYKVDGIEYLREPLLPCFDRAQTENDLGAALHLHLSAWRALTLTPTWMNVSEADGHYVLETRYAPIAGAALVEVRYDIYADGSIAVTESMSDCGGLSSLPPLFRFGMAFAMPGRFSELDFFGLGPWENYPDRQSSALLGRYRQHVNEQYHYGYVRTQESGAHGGLRFLRILDENGTGVELSAGEAFSASALPLSLKDLDVAYLESDPSKRNHSGQFGAAQHSLELKGRACEDQRTLGTTYVHIDQVQMGVGGINSWGQWPLEQYRIPAAPRSFHFLLRPVNN